MSATSKTPSPKPTETRSPCPPQADPIEDLPLLTVPEVARLLAVPRSMVYGLVHAQRLPVVRVSRYFRFRRSMVLAFITAQSQPRRPHHARR